MNVQPTADVPADTIAPDRHRLVQRAELEVRCSLT